MANEYRAELTDELMELVLEYGIEDVLKGVADVCRGGEGIHMEAKQYQVAGTYAHYAHAIEQLFEE